MRCLPLVDAWSCVRRRVVPFNRRVVVRPLVDAWSSVTRCCIRCVAWLGFRQMPSEAPQRSAPTNAKRDSKSDGAALCITLHTLNTGMACSKKQKRLSRFSVCFSPRPESRRTPVLVTFLCFVMYNVSAQFHDAACGRLFKASPGASSNGPPKV